MSFVDFRILVFRSKEDPYCYRIHQLNSQALSTFAVAATFFQQGQRKLEPSFSLVVHVLRMDLIFDKKLDG